MSVKDSTTVNTAVRSVIVKTQVSVTEMETVFVTDRLVTELDVNTHVTV